MKRTLFFLALLTLGSAVNADHNPPASEYPGGIRNLSMIESTVACAGAITPDAVAGIRDMGFVSIFNLRRPDEEGAMLEEEAAAAREAGLNYVHIPFSSQNPDAAAVDRFLAAIAEPANEPAFIHCAGGNRAAAMWFAKRALVDGWDIDRALEEAQQLGFSSESLRAFMTDYIESHR